MLRQMVSFQNVGGLLGKVCSYAAVSYDNVFHYRITTIVQREAHRAVSIAGSLCYVRFIDFLSKSQRDRGHPALTYGDSIRPCCIEEELFSRGQY